MKIDFESEKELEDFIVDHYNESAEFIIDGSTPHHVVRQLNLGVYGIADLVTFEEFSHLVVIGVFELKKEKITAAAFEQVFRYATGIERLMRKAAPQLNISVNPALVAPDIDQSCFILNYSEINYYRIEFSPSEGIVFNGSGGGWHNPSGAVPDQLDCIAKQLYANQVMYKKRAAELKKDAEDAESKMPEEG